VGDAVRMKREGEKLGFFAVIAPALRRGKGKREAAAA